MPFIKGYETDFAGLQPNAFHKIAEVHAYPDRKEIELVIKVFKDQAYADTENAKPLKFANIVISGAGYDAVSTQVLPDLEEAMKSLEPYYSDAIQVA